MKIAGISFAKYSEEISICFIAGSISLVFIFCWQFSPILPANLGMPFGYYGDFNKVKTTIEENEGLSIKKVTVNSSTLQEFWITVATPDKREFTLEIVNGSSVRDQNDKAEGVMISTRNYKGALFIPFDNSFWDFMGEKTPSNIEELLPQIDVFLRKVDQIDIEYEKLDWERSNSFIRDWERSKSFIRIKYVTSDPTIPK